MKFCFEFMDQNVLTITDSIVPNPPLSEDIALSNSKFDILE